jgi:glyoxylase-like metal-dependent hydrolase (beta-lactamase superfamily II)
MRGLQQDWFDVRQVAPGIHVIEEPLHEERVKSYLVAGRDRAVLVDTGMGVGDIRAVVEGLTALPVLVVQSHAHADHIGGAWRFSDIAIHRAEAAALAQGRAPDTLRGWFDRSRMSGPLPPYLDPETFAIPGVQPSQLLDGGETLDLGGRRLEVIHAPGHSSGGLVLLDYANRTLLSTDVAYLGELYCFHGDADIHVYAATLERLVALEADVDLVLPAHGPTPIDMAAVRRMRDAVAAVAGGRVPDAVVDGMAAHDFGSIRVRHRPSTSHPDGRLGRGGGPIEYNAGPASQCGADGMAD